MKTTSTKYIHADGPFADADRYGDEFPYWTVGIYDESDPYDAIKSYTCHSFEKAKNLAERMASDRNLELVFEASRP